MIYAQNFTGPNQALRGGPPVVYDLTPFSSSDGPLHVSCLFLELLCPSVGLHSLESSEFVFQSDRLDLEQRTLRFCSVPGDSDPRLAVARLGTDIVFRLGGDS